MYNFWADHLVLDSPLSSGLGNTSFCYQHSLVVYSSLCRIGASWCFHCPCFQFMFRRSCWQAFPGRALYINLETQSYIKLSDLLLLIIFPPPLVQSSLVAGMFCRCMYCDWAPQCCMLTGCSFL